MWRLLVLAEATPGGTATSPVTIIGLVLAGMFSVAGGLVTVWGALRGKREDNTAVRMTTFDQRVDAERDRLSKRINELEAEVDAVKVDRDRDREQIARIRRYMVTSGLDPDGWKT